MTQKLKILIVAIIVAAPLGGLLYTAPVSAADPVATIDCGPIGVSEKGPTKGKVCKKDPAACLSGKVDKKDDSKCLQVGNSCDKTTGICSNNAIVKDLNAIVNVLSGLVGVVVVGTIILGGIQYAAAGDKAEAVSAAKKRITNGVLALLAFLFIFAFLQWLIPGGIFK